MGISITNTKEDPILILPCGDSQVKHRNDPVVYARYLFQRQLLSNEHISPPTIYKGIDYTNLAPVLGATVLSFPCKLCRCAS